LVWLIEHCSLAGRATFSAVQSNDRFLRDFPEFRWGVSLKDWTRRVVEWNQHAGLFDELDEETFDDRVIASWQ
jgi:hypothetical protein